MTAWIIVKTAVHATLGVFWIILALTGWNHLKRMADALEDLAAGFEDRDEDHADRPPADTLIPDRRRDL
jgi:hypothetical protein